MTGLYIFSLAVGAPLLLWFAFAGDADADGFGGDGEGGGPLSVIPLSSVAFVLAFFGLTGLIGNATGTATVFVLLLALVIGVVAGVINSAAFGWLHRNSTSSDVMDSDLEGAFADVSLPITTEHRGKIIVSIAGAREQMTARSADGSAIESGEQVVILRVDGGIAVVAPLDAYRRSGR